MNRLWEGPNKSTTCKSKFKRNSFWDSGSRLVGEGNSNSHGARPVHLIITMTKWIRTSRLSIHNSRSVGEGWPHRFGSSSTLASSSSLLPSSLELSDHKSMSLKYEPSSQHASGPNCSSLRVRLARSWHPTSAMEGRHSGHLEVLEILELLEYRGTSLIRKHLPLGPYSRPEPRALWRF